MVEVMEFVEGLHIPDVAVLWEGSQNSNIHSGILKASPLLSGSSLTTEPCPLITVVRTGEHLRPGAAQSLRRI